MSLKHFLSAKPVVGNASIVGQGVAKGYFITPRDGQCFRVGTADFAGGIRVNLDGYLRAGGTNSLSGAVAFSFTKANSNNTDFLAVKIEVVAADPPTRPVATIKATLQLYTNGQTGVEHFVDTFTAAANYTDRHFDHINLIWRKTGNTFRLGMVLIDKDATDPVEPEYLHATEVELPYDWNFDTILSTTGALVFGKRYEAHTDVGIAQSAFWIGALASGVEWEQLALDTDAGLLRLATDPHTYLTATQGAWSKLITFNGRNASGKSTLGCRALTADSDYLECINTGVRATYKQGASPTGTWEFREPHALPARYGQHMTSILAAPSAQLTRSGDLVVQGLHHGNNNNHFSFLVGRCRPSDLMAIAPPVLITPAYWYSDSSNSNAITRWNGDITPAATHVTEAHCSIAVLINETAGYVDVAGGAHSDRYTNYPASGDAIMFTGFVARLCDELPVQTRPVPLLSNDVNGGTTYGVWLSHESKSFLALRHGDTGNGRLGLVKVDGSLRLTDRVLTHSPTGISNYDAGIPTAMIKLDDRHALLVCQVRAQIGSGANAGTWATFAVVIDLDAHGSSTEGWYGARTGDLLADEMGSVTWLRTSCLIDANAAVTQIDAANLDITALAQAYESMVGGLAVHHDGTTIHVAHFVAVQDDPTFTTASPWKNRWADGWRLVCYTFSPTTKALTHVRTHDLTALAQQMGPATSHDQPFLEAYSQEPTFLYGEGNRVVIGLNVSGGADITSHANAGNEGRLGTHLSLGEIRDWHTATPTITAHVNAVSASSRGGAVLRPYRIANSTRCGLYIVDSGAAGSLTALYAARRESLDLTPYFTEEAVPTVEEIVAGINADTDLDDKIAAAAQTVVPQDKTSVYLEADGADLKLTITASGETITAYSLTGVAIARSSPYAEFGSDTTGLSASVTTTTIDDQADLAAEDVDVFITVTTSQSGELPQEKIRWRPPTEVLAAIEGIEGGGSGGTVIPAVARIPRKARHRTLSSRGDRLIWDNPYIDLMPGEQGTYLIKLASWGAEAEPVDGFDQPVSSAPSTVEVLDNPEDQAGRYWGVSASGPVFTVEAADDATVGATATVTLSITDGDDVLPPELTVRIVSPVAEDDE